MRRENLSQVSVLNGGDLTLCVRCTHCEDARGRGWWERQEQERERERERHTHTDRQRQRQRNSQSLHSATSATFRRRNTFKL